MNFSDRVLSPSKLLGSLSLSLPDNVVAGGAVVFVDITVLSSIFWVLIGVWISEDLDLDVPSSSSDVSGISGLGFLYWGGSTQSSAILSQAHSASVSFSLVKKYCPSRYKQLSKFGGAGRLVSE